MKKKLLPLASPEFCFYPLLLVVGISPPQLSPIFRLQAILTSSIKGLLNLICPLQIWSQLLLRRIPILKSEIIYIPDILLLMAFMSPHMKIWIRLNYCVPM